VSYYRILILFTANLENMENLLKITAKNKINCSEIERTQFDPKKLKIMTDFILQYYLKLSIISF
jgi:hypothetical protein